MEFQNSFYYGKNNHTRKLKLLHTCHFSLASLLNCILNCIIDTSRFSFTDPVNKINKLANNYYDRIEFFFDIKSNVFSEVKLISRWNSINIVCANIRLHVPFCMDFSYMFELYIIIRYVRVKIINCVQNGIRVQSYSYIFVTRKRSSNRNESK